MAIETLSNPTPTVNSFYADAIAEGYVYECSCGELFNNADYAYTCRKCRNYCVFGYCTHVTDVRTGKVVLGKEPTAAEHAEAAAEAELRWAAEHAEFQQWRDEQDAQYELWQQGQEEADAIRKAEEEEDQMWDIQEELMR